MENLEAIVAVKYVWKKCILTAMELYVLSPLQKKDSADRKYLVTVSKINVKNDSDELKQYSSLSFF